MPTPSDDNLFDAAVTHAIRLQANPRNAAALEALAAWRARSPAHEKAWAEIAEIHGMTGSLLARRPGENGLSRRKALGLGAVGLGLAAGAGLVGPGMFLAAKADHLTSTAEISDITLADGSRISLGPDSAITVDIQPDRREVLLLSGMIWCAVAPGTPALQFRCGRARIESAAGELSLSHERGRLSLALDRGQARILTGADAGTELTAGDWLELEESGRIIRKVGLTASEASGWRDGLIVVEAEPLSAVVARIARWLPGRVVIADPGLGAKLVSGVFDMDRPRDALLAAVSPHGAGLYRISPWLVVITAL
ncbi:MAG: FecR domain-containing protein [Paracoccus sp. (in: a-proteobacteria)]|uniref:FecR family protein n=1 Tax=Paracoccus sp. TaxID=267 RepID=UPI0039E283DF